MGAVHSNFTRDRRQPPRGGYRFLGAVVNAIIDRAGPLIAKLDEPHEHGGNPGFGAEALLSAIVLRYAMRRPYANAFLNDLGTNHRLLQICGLPRAPGERAFSEFKNKKLVPNVSALEAIIVDLFLSCGVEIERLRALGLVPADKPMLGEAWVMDSTDVEAWARPSRRSRKTGDSIPSKDPDAAWGHRTAKTRRSYKASSGKSRKANKDATSGKDDKDELYFGYSINVIVDANHGLPMFAATRPANASDNKVMIPDLDACLELYRMLSPRYFLGDKGYDSLKNILYLVKLGFIPIIAVRTPRKTRSGQRLFDGLYVADGRPTCVGQQPMEYVSTDRNKGHLFRCPTSGCHLKDKVLTTGFCNDQHYEKPEGKLLRIVGLVPRCSEQWKTEYKKRPIIERYNGSVKHSRLLNQHRYVGIDRMQLHVLLSTLTYLATALAHLQADDYAKMRHMSIRLSPNRRQRTAPKTKPSCRDPDCECCIRWREAA